MTEQAFPRGKRKSTPSTAATATTSTTNSSAPEKDFLFGSIEPPSKKTKNKQPHPKDAVVSKTISALPLGGGAVLPGSSSSNGKNYIPPKIELLTFGKLGKGMKVLGAVREVKEEYAVISLPTMLVGFVRREEVSFNVSFCSFVIMLCCVSCFMMYVYKLDLFKLC
jgi:hypothetical protein